MVISRAVVGKKIFGRQTDGVQALWKRLYPWTDYTWARLYPWTDYSWVQPRYDLSTSMYCIIDLHIYII